MKEIANVVHQSNILLCAATKPYYLLYNNYLSIGNIASGFYDCNIWILLTH